jgi:hypothetical protein
MRRRAGEGGGAVDAEDGEGVVFEAVALAGDVGGLDHSSDGSEKDVVEKPADLGRRAVVGGGCGGWNGGALRLVFQGV